jgi:hypothetical protein
LTPAPLALGVLQEALLFVQNEKHKAEYCYISWLARCYIMNGNPRQAWEVYLKVSQPIDNHPLTFLGPGSKHIHLALCCHVCMHVCMTCPRLLWCG